jgi:hypothetical protein
MIAERGFYPEWFDPPLYESASAGVSAVPFMTESMFFFKPVALLPAEVTMTECR